MKSLRHSPTRSFALLGLSMTASIALFGCAPVASQLSEATVESAVGTLEETENLRRIDTITASPEFQRSLARTSGSLVRGIMDEVNGDLDVNMKEVDAAAEDLGFGLGRGLARGVVAGVGGKPDPGKMVDDAITGALASAASDQNRERAQLLASEVTATIVRTAMTSMVEGIDQSLSGPSVDPLNPGTDPSSRWATASPQSSGLEHALGSMVREVSRQATLGFDAGMEDIRKSNRAEHEGILGRTSTVGWGILIAVLGACLLGSIAIILALAIANSRRRKERERMLTTMWMMFASHGSGFDETTRAELLRQFGIASPKLTTREQASP